MTLHLIYQALIQPHLTIVILFGETADNFAEQDTKTTKQGSPCFDLHCIQIIKLMLVTCLSSLDGKI